MTEQWHYFKGTIYNREGWVIGNVPFTTGDEADVFNGRLMSSAPELYALLKTITDPKVVASLADIEERYCLSEGAI